MRLFGIFGTPFRIVIVISLLHVCEVVRGDDEWMSRRRTVAFEVGAIQPPLAQSLDGVLNRIKDQVDTCVLVVKSNGGYVAEAEALTEVIGKYRNVRFVAYVRSGISAAIWPIIACEKIYMEEGGTVGGALIYQLDMSTGSVSVDEKFNSIWQARMRSLVEKNGHPVEFVMAMMVPQRTDRKGTRGVSTYTAAEASKAGFAEVVRSIDGVFPDIAFTNHEFVDALFHSRMLADRLAGHWFTIHYDPGTVVEKLSRRDIDIIATRIRRTTRSSGPPSYRHHSHIDIRRTPGKRPQNDEEYRVSQGIVRDHVRGIIKTARDFQLHIDDSFAEERRWAVLRTDEESVQREGKSFVRKTVVEFIEQMQRRVEVLEPIISRNHYKAMLEEIEQARQKTMPQPR